MCLGFSLGPSSIEVAPTFLFEIGSSSTTVSDPVNEAATFFAHFEQVETNNRNSVDFWGAASPYMDFHGYLVPEECVVHLEAVYNNCGDFM